jgi:hypothetical protein
VQHIKQAHSVSYNPLISSLVPLFQTVFHYIIFIYVSFHTPTPISCPFPFLLLLIPPDSPLFTPSHYYYHYHHHFRYGSTKEQERDIFGLLSLAYLAQLDDLQFYTFSCKWQNFIFVYGWVILHDTYFFFTQPSVFGHLGWFHSLTIVNGATKKYGYAGVSLVHWFIITQLYVPKWYWQGFKVGLFLLFW